ncbi:nuclear transport factor 2 family protein [Fibrella sp. ES10-3-2-2]
MNTLAIFLIALLLPISKHGHAFFNQQFINQQVMQKNPEQTVHEFLTAVQQGKLDKAIPLLHPEIQWHQPGSHQFAGQKHSRDELVQMISGMFQFTANSLRLTTFDNLAVNGNQVACVVHWQAIQEAGGRLSVDNIDSYTVVDGLITQATIFSADLRQENTFWPN